MPLLMRFLISYTIYLTGCLSISFTGSICPLGF
jgi:hypothetical protein